MRDLKKAKNPFKANFRIEKDEFEQFKTICTLMDTTATNELVRFIREFNENNTEVLLDYYERVQERQLMLKELYE